MLNSPCRLSENSLLVFGLFTLLVAPALGEPGVDWVRSLYASATTLPERARGQSALATDPAGNLLVVGQVHPATDWDAMSAKYDEQGNLLWTWLLDRGGDDLPLGLRVDDRGDLYWLGDSELPWGFASKWLVKQDAAGGFLWERALPGFVGAGLGLELRPGGGVVVAGAGSGGALKLSAFDAAGQELWTLEDPAMASSPQALLVTDDSFAVSGRLKAPDTNGVRTLLADADGSLRWAHLLSTPGPSRARGIADLGDAFLVFGETMSESGRDVLLFLLEKTGGLRWSQVVDAGGRDFVDAFSVSREGLLVVAGDAYKKAERRHAPFILKVNKTGQVQSLAYAETRTLEPPMALAFDGDDLLAGAGSTAADEGFVLQRFDPEGRLRWEAKETGTRSDGVEALRVLPSGDILTLAAGRGDLSLHGYSAQGDRLWSAEPGIYSGATEAVGPKALVADPVDGVYVLGRVVSARQQTAFVAHLDRDGIERWRLPLPASYAYPLGLRMTPTGDLMVMASGQGNLNPWMRISLQGAAVAEGTLALSPGDYPSAFSLGPAGDIYIAGDYSGDGFYGVFIARFDSQGSREWLTRTGDPGFGNFIVGLETAPQGGVIFAAQACEGGDCRPLLGAVGENGALIWQRQHAPMKEDDRVLDLALNRVGDIFLTGRSLEDGDQDLFLGKYASTDGARRWNIRFGGEDWEEGEAVAATWDGDVLVTGNQTGGVAAMLTARFDGADGSPQWALTYDGSAGGNDLGQAIAVGTDGVVHVAGSAAERGFPSGLTVIEYADSGL